MNLIQKTSLMQILLKLKKADIKNFLNLVNRYVIEDISSDAYINSILKNRTVMYAQIKNLSDEIFDEFSEQRKQKSRNINNPIWLKSYSIPLNILLKKINNDRLFEIFKDRTVLDSFGFLLNEGSLKNYLEIDDEIISKITVFVIPNIQHVREKLLLNINSKWVSYLNALKINLDLPAANKKSAILFVLDPSGEVLLKHNSKVTYGFSHTKHLLQHMQAFVDRGYSVIVKQKGENHLIEVSDLLDRLQIKEKFSEEDIDNYYDIVGYCSIYFDDFIQSKYTMRKNVTNILIQPAVHWLESPRLFQSNFLTVIQVVAPVIDIIVSQNKRMIELTKSLLELGGNRASPENFLVVPLGIWKIAGERISVRNRVRNYYGFDSNIKAIVNGGGAWDWTATDLFLEAFLDYCQKNPNTKLRFVQMGIRQPQNIDHQKTVTNIEKILSKYKSIASKYVKIEDWNKASKMLPDALFGFDYGFSVSKISVEAFQAHRVRVTEYVQYGLPPIINSFDSLSDILFKSSHQVSDLLNFSEVFYNIESESSAEYQKKVTELKKAISRINQIGNSHKIVDAFEKNSPMMKLQNQLAVNEHAVNMMKHLSTFGWYSLEGIISENSPCTIAPQYRWYHNCLKMANRFSKIVLPKKYHSILYGCVARWIYERRLHNG